jgi:hypothetical protein
VAKKFGKQRRENHGANLGESDDTLNRIQGDPHSTGIGTLSTRLHQPLSFECDFRPKRLKLARQDTSIHRFDHVDFLGVGFSAGIFDHCGAIAVALHIPPTIIDFQHMSVLGPSEFGVKKRQNEVV